MNEILSRIVAELFDKSKGGEELSSKIQRLRDEIKKVVEGENSIFGKFRGLVESFREIIPEEKQRLNAAIQALSATSKLSRQEIVNAVGNQLEELKILEKVLLGAAPGRDELKVMEAKAREMKSEITKLRERIVWLESEEKGVRNGIAAREKEMELAEKAMRELFADIGTEITGIKKKVEEIAAESASAQPIPQGDSIMTDILGGKKGSNEQKIEVIEPSAPQDTKPHKKCPMCGGQMNDYGDKWQCYACAHEELKKDEVQVKSESNESFAPQDAESRKKCPMCGGQMSDYGDKWQCYSCAHEESKEGEVKGKSELTNAPKPASAPAPISDLFPAVVPSASLFPDEKQEQKKGSVQSQHQSLPKTKNCPVCQKKMIWYDLEKLWRCSNCDYQRSI